MNKFNRILLASGLAATASLMANSAAFAQTQGTVNLSGTVAPSLTMTVTPETNSNSSLDLSPGNHTAKIAAIQSVSTNSANGLFVHTTSTTGYQLRLPGRNEGIELTMKDAVGANASSATSNLEYVNGDIRRLNHTSSDSRGNAPDSSIFIAYNVTNDQEPGTYTASITFTVFDK